VCVCVCMCVRMNDTCDDNAMMRSASSIALQVLEYIYIYRYTYINTCSCVQVVETACIHISVYKFIHGACMQEYMRKRGFQNGCKLVCVCL